VETALLDAEELLERRDRTAIAGSSGIASSCGELPRLSIPVFNAWRSGNV
jgi:hypothetical protein